jgi:hypothetical protein
MNSTVLYVVTRAIPSQPDYSKERVASIFRPNEARTIRTRRQTELSSLPASAGLLLGLLQTLKMEAICTSERSGFLRTARRYKPEDHARQDIYHAFIVIITKHKNCINDTGFSN